MVYKEYKENYPPSADRNLHMLVIALTLVPFIWTISSLDAIGRLPKNQKLHEHAN